MFAVIGDIHLGAQEQYLPELYKDQIRNLNKMLRAIEAKDVDTVILAGDIMDSAHAHPRYSTALIRLFARYPDMRFILLMGNHEWESIGHTGLDVLYTIGKLGMFNFEVVKKPRIETIGGIRVFLCPHPYLLDMPKKAHWAVGHFAWNQAHGDNGYKLETGNSPKGRWLLGDLHTPQHGDRYVYAGSAGQALWIEGHEKRWLLVDHDDWESVRHTPTYQLGKAEVANDEDVLALSEDVLWSVKCTGGYALTAEIREKMRNVVHSTASLKRSDDRARVLLDDSVSGVIADPLQALPAFLDRRKDMTPKRRKHCLALAKKLERTV